MEKSSKGNIGLVIFVSIAIVIQAGIIGLIVLFWQSVQETNDEYIKHEAIASAEWGVDYELAASQERSHYRGYLLNAEQTLRTYWHSQDKEFRVTLESEALKTLMAKKILVVKESEAGEHLFLTVYYNSLRVKNPSQEDLVPIYQVVRYQKPEIAKIYDRKKLEWEEEKEKKKQEKEEAEAEAEAQNSNQKPTNAPEEEVVEAPEEELTLEDLKYYYPFEEDAILVETDEYIVFENKAVAYSDETLNHMFLAPYLTENTFIGDYGWEKGIFYHEEEVEEVVEEETTEEETEEVTE